MKYWLLTTLLVVFSLPASAVEPEARALIHGADEPIEITLEIADTPEETQRGLMFRQKMPANHGMWFDFGYESRRVAMWMKNTHIPLDMLFLNKHKVVMHIARNTVPHSTKRIYSPVPVQYVLEVNAGFAATNDIKAGDRVEIIPLVTNEEIEQQIQPE